MKFKDIRFEVKGLDDKGSFQGYAAAYSEDLGGDQIVPGAFTKSIKDNSSRPLLWHHKSDEPIGMVTRSAEDTKGLAMDGQLNLDVQRAREVHSLMRQGAVKGLSIGYDTIQKEFKNGVRLLKEIRLWEVSLLPFPMNSDAQVTAVKSMEDLENLLHELLAYKGIERLSAEKTALIEQVIEKLSALQAAKAPEAAMQDEIAPEILHAASESSDRISKMLRGEI